MKYKSLIDPELRRIARKIPYSKFIIRPANLFQALSFRLTATPSGVARRTLRICGHDGLPLRVDIFEPSDAEGRLPCLIYAHGGAFSYKAAAYHKKLACIYAARVGCRVLFPDYHLLPKYPHPAAYNDVLSLYRYALDHADELCVERSKVGVAGDSAGAMLAALVCNNCEREGLDLPCLQMLIYPATDADMSTDSMSRFADTPLWNSQNNRRMWAYYLEGLSDEEARAASPMHSPLPRRLPCTYIETAEYDCLRDEGILYGEKLRNAGAKVEINNTSGTIHGYDLAINSKVAARNIDRRTAFLKAGF